MDSRANELDLGVDPMLDRAQVLARSSANALRAAQAAGDTAENVRDLRTQERQDGNDHDGDEDQDQRVLDETLTFFTRQIHLCLLVGLAIGSPELDSDP